MSDKPEANFKIIFKKLDEFTDLDEARESAAVADEAEEIQELRRIIEEAGAAECVEFATT